MDVDNDDSFEIRDCETWGTKAPTCTVTIELATIKVRLIFVPFRDLKSLSDHARGNNNLVKTDTTRQPNHQRE